MSYISLNTAASGMSACSTSLDVIANNLANANTNGFKSSRANFEDLFYQEFDQPGLPAGDASQRPTGLYVGLGTQISGTQLNFTQGPTQATTQWSDMLINGDGFFQIELPSGVSTGIGYTRAGNFVANAEGQLVLGNAPGYRLVPAITIPADASQLTISQDGIVSGSVPGQAEPQEFGQITISRFVNPTGLETIGGNVYLQTAASGEPLEGQPSIDGFGGIQNNALEASNVDPVTELVSLIKTQRTFEMNSQVIQASNETLQNITNLAMR